LEIEEEKNVFGVQKPNIWFLISKREMVR